MKERRVVFAVLLLWALAFALKSWLEAKPPRSRRSFSALEGSAIPLSRGSRMALTG